MIRIALIACLLLGSRIAAAAQETGVSTWTITGDGITLRYTFPQTLAAYLAPPRAALPTIEKISGYVLSRVSVQQQGKPCPAVDQGYDLGRANVLYAGPGLISFEILFRCPNPTGALTLRNEAFFELAPGQIGMADLRVNGGAPMTRVLTAGNAAIQVGANQTPSPSGPAAYGWLGTKHALSTLLCLCSALGLALSTRHRRGFALVAGGLCGGYLLASIAAGAGGLLLQPQAAQAAGGLLIALLAAQLTVRNTARSGPAAAGLTAVVIIATAVAFFSGQTDAALALIGTGIFGAVVVALPRDACVRDAALLVQAALTGLIDGFSLTTRFAPLREFHTLGTGHLLAYDGGALLGVLLTLGAAMALRNLLQRQTPSRHAPLCRDLLAAILASAGAWSMLALS